MVSFVIIFGQKGGYREFRSFSLYFCFFFCNEILVFRRQGLFMFGFYWSYRVQLKRLIDICFLVKIILLIGLQGLLFQCGLMRVQTGFCQLLGVSETYFSMVRQSSQEQLVAGRGLVVFRQYFVFFDVLIFLGFRLGFQYLFCV